MYCTPAKTHATEFIVCLIFETKNQIERTIIIRFIFGLLFFCRSESSWGHMIPLVAFVRYGENESRRSSQRLSYYEVKLRPAIEAY